ncbi:MAG: hypothetical protein ACT4P4_08435 [Betaproteobacteria bacterium]
MAWQIAYFSVCTVVVGILAFNAGARRLGPLRATFIAIELLGAATVIAALVLNNLHLRHAAVRQS